MQNNIINNLEYYKELIFNKKRWLEISHLLINVLHINIFVIDTENNIIVGPDKRKYGGKLLTNEISGFDLTVNSKNIINQFEDNGYYLESENRFKLHSFSVPIDFICEDIKSTLGYVILGPVILNKKLDAKYYSTAATLYGTNESELLEELNEIRVVSHIMINAIIKLLTKIITQQVEAYCNQCKLLKISDHDVIDLSLKTDKLLASILDMALKLTHSDAGSIMLMDVNKNYLTVNVSKGIDRESTSNVKIKIGEGLAGLVALNNEPLLIDSGIGSENSTQNNRIKNLLKRPDIKQSYIMPLNAHNRTYGVLNLSTKKDKTDITENIDKLKHIEKILSTVFH